DLGIDEHPGELESVAVDIAVTPEAAGYIGDRGGRVYLWQVPVGKSWATDHMAFIDPGGEIPFELVWIDGVALMLAEDLELPRSIHVRLDRIPRRLRVEWDGLPWGRRGGGDGGIGG